MNLEDIITISPQIKLSWRQEELQAALERYNKIAARLGEPLLRLGEEE